MSTIAIDATYAVDPRPTGVSVYSRRLIESLAELESSHRFLVGYRASRWRRRHDLPQFNHRFGGMRARFSACLFQNPWTFWLPWRAELFHSVAQRPAPFRFRKEVVTILDVFPLTGRDYSTPDFRRKFSALLIEAAARADRIITPSQYTADELVRHAAADKEKIRVIPLGVDPVPEAALRNGASTREPRQEDGTDLILEVGVVQTRKNTLGAIQAFERLPARYRMAIVGGDGYGSEAVHDYIRRAGLADRVKVMGYVPAEEVRRLYRTARVLLFPSLEEGFGLPVLEAMAHGLPVVTSATSSLPEVGGDAVLYCDPRDERDVAEKTLQAAEDQKLRQEMIEKGLARAREFTWRRTAQQTLRVYDEALIE
ncbi:MAG: glycosyltransferase family 4 protein [Terriglobia bacterium]